MSNNPQPLCTSDDPDEAAELRELFESIDIVSWAAARRLCAACPVLEGCGRLVRDTAERYRWAGGPAGTWAGELWSDGKLKRERVTAP